MDGRTDRQTSTKQFNQQAGVQPTISQIVEVVNTAITYRQSRPTAAAAEASPIIMKTKDKVE